MKEAPSLFDDAKQRFDVKFEDEIAFRRVPVMAFRYAYSWYFSPKFAILFTVVMMQILRGFPMAIMTKEQASEWKARWERVYEFETEELRKTPPKVKFRQICDLYETARQLGWLEKLREEDDAVLERWTEFRRALSG